MDATLDAEVEVSMHAQKTIQKMGVMYQNGELSEVYETSQFTIQPPSLTEKIGLFLGKHSPRGERGEGPKAAIVNVSIYSSRFSQQHTSCTDLNVKAGLNFLLGAEIEHLVKAGIRVTPEATINAQQSSGTLFFSFLAQDLHPLAAEAHILTALFFHSSNTHSEGEEDCMSISATGQVDVGVFGMFDVEFGGVTIEKSSMYTKNLATVSVHSPSES